MYPYLLLAFLLGWGALSPCDQHEAIALEWAAPRSVSEPEWIDLCVDTDGSWDWHWRLPIGPMRTELKDAPLMEVLVLAAAYHKGLASQETACDYLVRHSTCQLEAIDSVTTKVFWSAQPWQGSVEFLFDQSKKRIIGGAMLDVQAQTLEKMVFRYPTNGLVLVRWERLGKELFNLQVH